MARDRDDEEMGFGGLRGKSGGRKCRDCDFIDYKDVSSLRRYLSGQGKLLSRKRTSTCAKCQRLVACAVKRARFMGILSYIS